MVIYISGQTLPLNKLTTLILAGAEPRRVGHVQQTAVKIWSGFIASQGTQKGIVGQWSAGRDSGDTAEADGVWGVSLIQTPA